MKKAQQPQQPKRTDREIAQTAYRHALNLRQTRQEYDKILTQIHARLERSSAALDEQRRYGNTIGANTGNIVQMLAQLQDNMRLDLLVQYAADIQMSSAVLDALRPELTNDELAEMNRWLGE